MRGGDWFIAVVEPDGNGSGGISLNGGRQLSAYQLISGDVGGGGRGAFISGVHLLEWAFLTPVMLLVVKQLQQSAVVPPVHRYTDAFQHIQTAMHRYSDAGVGGGRTMRRYTPPSSLRLILAHFVMLACGCTGAFAPLPVVERMLALVGGGCFMLYVLYHVVRCDVSAAAASACTAAGPAVGTHPDGGAMTHRMHAVATCSVVFWLVSLAAAVGNRRLGGEDDGSGGGSGHLWLAIGNAVTKLCMSILLIDICTRIQDGADDLICSTTDKV